MADSPSLAIVIVNYNAREELEVCLGSLQASSYQPLEIVVVDNGSSDGALTQLPERWPTVRFIDAGENLGFARANNLGIRATRTDLVLLLNPDTIVPADAIGQLVDVLRAHPDAAAVGPRLVDGHGHIELSFGWSISPLGELKQKCVARLHRRGRGVVHRWIERRLHTSGPREWLTGACLLVRRRDLDAVGLVDERYFLYTEDVDLCVSLRQRGRDVRFAADIEVVHLGGRSASRNPATARLRRQSQIAYYEKHHPRWAPWLRAYLRAAGKYTG